MCVSLGEKGLFPGIVRMDISCDMLNIRSRMGEYPENVKNMEISRSIISQEMLYRNIRRYSESKYAMWAYPENILS